MHYGYTSLTAAHTGDRHESTCPVRFLHILRRNSLWDSYTDFWFSVGVVVPFAQSRHQKDRYDRQRSVTGPDIGCRIAVPLRCDA
jgi:hypothetical protein